MPFQTIPINVTGPAYKDRSTPLSAQETRNFYPEVSQSGKDKYVIKSFPGQRKIFDASSGGADRGMHNMVEIAYRVVDNTLYRVSSGGSHVGLGTIPGSERCIMDDDGESLFIVADGVVTQYNSTDDSVTEVTDVNIAGAKSVTFINNVFIYTFDTYSVFSDVGNGAVASGLNAVGADAKPDDMVRDYAFNQIDYRFGVRTVEQWYNSGVGSPPWDRVEGQFFNTGLGAIHSLANSRSFLYWLGTDKQVYRAVSGQSEIITTAAISGEMQGYSEISDAFGQMLFLDEKEVYVLTFPTENHTWAFIEDYGDDGWFELSAGVDLGRYNAGSILGVYGEQFIGDYESGDLYRLDFDTYTQGGEQWQRRRVMGSINGDKLGQHGKRVKMSRFELILETGVGTVSGQGEDPQIMIEPSYDGGRTWDSGTWMKIGRLGEYNIRAEWWSVRSFYDMIIRITTSDPVAYNIYSAAIDLKLAGR